MAIIDPKLNEEATSLYEANLSSMWIDEEADALISGREEISSSFLRHQGKIDLALEECGFETESLGPIKLDASSFEDDSSYCFFLSLPSFKQGALSYGKQAYLPGEIFVCADEIEDEDYPLGRPPLGYFIKEVPYPILRKGGIPWMSVIPHEKATMAKAIDESKGKVLCLGCGMGYFAYCASSKEEVTSITIVDNDPALLAFFSSHILPRFPHKQKITLVEEDAFSYLERQEKGGYDFLFADLWHNADDGLSLYRRLLDYEDRAKSASYWIEDGLLCYFRRFLITAIYEDILISQGEDIAYDESIEEDALLLAIQRTFAKPIASSEELKEVISLEKVKERLRAIPLWR